MQLSTIIAILGAAIASSRTVGVPESGQDVQDIDIADFFGDRIPGQNPVSFCKGDRSHDGLLVPLGEAFFEPREMNLTNSQQVKITQVDLVPNPPARGQNLTVSAAATVNEAVTQGAVVEIKVKFLATTVYHKKFDICEEMGKLGQNCPLLPTNIFVNETYPIPKKGFPHGSYSFTANAKFLDGRPITCIEGKVKL